MTYQDAVSGTNNTVLHPTSTPIFAARLSMPTIEYVGADGHGGLLVYGMNPTPTAWTPSQDDQQATNWIKGGDQPPSR